MAEMAADRTIDCLTLTSGLVAAYVSRNSIPIAELPNLIASLRAAFERLVQGETVQPEAPQRPVPTAAQIRRSITPDALISMIDGKRYKTLKRHLTAHNLDPASYRTLYGLPVDYPMVAPSYSAFRETIARSTGLGTGHGRSRKARG